MNVLVVGAGQIGLEYVKVLLALGTKPIVVTRGEENARILKTNFPTIEVITGGLENFLKKGKPPSFCIIATPIENLAKCTILLLQKGAKILLVEKPLTFSLTKALQISSLANKNNAKVFIAFNRRHYQSVLKAKELIISDGGVSSFHFDFTEAVFRIDPQKYCKKTMKFWGLANSSHVINTAFFLCGQPSWIKCRYYGNDVHWHPTGSIFTGFGETVKGTPFTYHSNWGCPGRWNLEIMTNMRKLIFSPMERLKQQKKNGFAIEEVDADYKVDIDFKPGFYNQIKSFLDNKNLLSIDELGSEMQIIRKIFNY